MYCIQSMWKSKYTPYKVSSSIGGQIHFMFIQTIYKDNGDIIE